MSERSLPIFIGRRYAALSSGRLLVGFISRLSVIGLSLGVAVLVTVLSVMNGFDRELREKILALLPHISITTMPGYPLLNSEQWQPYIAQLQAHPDVTGVAPLVELQGMVVANGLSKGVVLNGIRPRLEKEVSIIDQFVVSGRLEELTAGAYGMVVGSQLARQLDLAVGDQLNLVSTEVPVTILGGFPRRKNFTVVGIFNVGSQLDASLAYIHLEDAQTLYRMGDNIHGLRVQTSDLFAVNDIGGEVRDILPGESLMRYWTVDFGNIYQNIQLSKNLVGLLLFLLVAVAAFNVVVSLFMVVRDKQGDIAILRTMGTSVNTIRNIFVVQGTIIGVIGTFAGLLLGVFFSLTVTDFVAWLEDVLALEFLSAEIYPVNYLPAQLQWNDIVMVCSISIALSIVATLYPAFAAARTRPAEALRYE